MASVAMKHTASGRTMRASREAFDREYSTQGWEIVDTAPAADATQPEPENGAAADESEASDEAPAKSRSRARSKE